MYDFPDDSGVNMDGGSTYSYAWDAPTHVLESIDDFALDPQDNADKWFGQSFCSLCRVKCMFSSNVYIQKCGVKFVFYIRKIFMIVRFELTP